MAVRKDDIKVTKKGAFRRDSAVDTDRAPTLVDGLQQLFKLEVKHRDEPANEKYVLVTSEDGKWTAEQEWNRDLAHFFGSQAKVYVVGIAHPKHGLLIISGIQNLDHDW